MRQTAPNNNSGILKDPTIVMPLIDLSNFWRSLERSLIRCKVELKLRWTKYCVLSALCNGNNTTTADSNNIIFTIKDTKSYVSFVTLSAKDNQKLSKIYPLG